MQSVQNKPTGIRRLFGRFRELPPSFFAVSVAPGKHKVFKWFLIACVSLSISATCIENGLHPLLLLLLPLIAASLLRSDYSRPFFLSPRVCYLVFTVYVVLLSIGALVFRSTFTLPTLMVYFTFGVLMIRVFNPLTDRNVEQLILLSLGLILINCIITNHLVFGIVLPIYLFTLMGTLLLFHVARTPAPAGEAFDPASGRDFRRGIIRQLAKYSLLIVIMSILFFVLLPRPFMTIPGFRFGAPGGGMAEMAQRISYRDMIGMGDRQRIAFMVRMEAGSLARMPYWRGRILDKNDGRGWAPARDRAAVAKPVPIDYSKVIIYHFMPYKLQTNTIYAYGYPVSATGKMDHPLYVNPGGEIVVDSPFLFSDSYRVTVMDRPFPVAKRSLSLNLDKTGITPKIAALARQWTEGLNTPERKARRIVSRLTNDYKYVLQPAAPPEDVNPMEYFLFQSREGNCEYFAGALGLMLRSEGIPARLIEGFSGMDKSSVPDEYIVRFAHAHAWVEASLDGENWTTLDATPPSRLDLADNWLRRLATDLYDTIEKKWTKYVVYFDRSDQARIFEGFNELLAGGFELPSVAGGGRVYLMAIFFGGAAVLAVFLVVYAMRRKNRSASSIYLSAMEDLVKAGVLESVDQWHERNTEAILTNAPGAAKSARKFMKLYFDHRFGRNGASNRELEAARAELLQAAKTVAGRG